MISLRCSQLPLVQLCPASIDVRPELRVESDSEPARLGTAVHELLRRHIAGADFDPIEVAYTHRVNINELLSLYYMGLRQWDDLQEWFADRPEAEVELTTIRDGVALSGHIDLLACGEEGEVRILDWKSGRMDVDHSDQVKGYALLAIDDLPYANRAYTAVALIRDQVVDGAKHERQQLHAWWKDLLAKVTQEPRPYNPGPHCRFCPRALECPAKDRAIAQAFGITSGYNTYSLPTDMTDRATKLVAAMDAVRFLEHLAEQVKLLVKGDVLAHGGVMDAADGRKLVAKDVRTTEIVAAEAWEILSEELSPELLLTVVDVGKTKLEALVRDAAPRGSKGEEVKRLMARLQKAGATRTNSATRLEIKRGTSNGNGALGTEQQPAIVQAIGAPGGEAVPD